MQNVEKISATMTPELLVAIRESVAAGDYASTSEVLREAVRIWQRQRVEDEERLAAVRARAQRSIDDPRPSVTDADLEAHLSAAYDAART